MSTGLDQQSLQLFQVALDNTSKVEAKVAQERDSRRRQHEPLLLRRRDNSIVEEPSSQPIANSPLPQTTRPQ